MDQAMFLISFLFGSPKSRKTLSHCLFLSMGWLWPSGILFFLFQVSICTSSSLTADLFESWCKEYGKTYSSDQEKQHRLRVFEHNNDYITQHNSKSDSTYTLGLNAFADLTHQEFKSKFSGLSASPNNLIRLNRGSSTFGNVDVPSSVDWRKEGAVTDVKDEGDCDASWAFSATGAIEGINKIFTGSLVSLSAQELIDCDRTDNRGCDGGLVDYAFQYVVRNKGIVSEDDYHYSGEDGTCIRDKLKTSIVTIDGYEEVPANDEQALVQAVAKQPVSVSICSSEIEFQLYKGGIFIGPCSNELDHAVLIVGYDSQDGVDYWIVKNSWGEGWGMNGYIHIARSNGSDPSEGLCGINMQASCPVKTSPNPPPPAPVQCNYFTSCPAGQTCCCASEHLDICWSWWCCEMESAVCCNSHQCCPSDLPVCDTERNLCLKKPGNFTFAKPLQSRGLSGKWNPIFQNWNAI